MMRFFRAIWGCSSRMAAYDEYYERERADRAVMQREIDDQLAKMMRHSKRAQTAADRLVAGFKRDTTRW